MNNLTRKKILIISPEAWGVSLLSKHQYAIVLAKKGNEVWFLEPNSLLETYCDVPNVHLIRQSFDIRGLRFFPKWLRKKVLGKKADVLQRNAGVKFDIVWSFDNSRYADLDVFPLALRIHHLMDFHYDFQLKSACQSAHICFGMSTEIVAKLRSFNKNSFFIDHGFSVDQKIPRNLPLVQEKFKAAYAGNLLVAHIAWDWLYDLVNANVDTHFFFFGGYKMNNLNPNVNAISEVYIEQMSGLKNATLMGEYSPPELLGFLEDADILLHAYHNDNPSITSNPLKIMTYLGTGKPIVASEISSYKNSPDLVYCAKSKEEYCALFLQVKENLNEEQGEKKATRIAHALANSYENHLREIDALINTIQR
jgi:hypothetical protein